MVEKGAGLCSIVCWRLFSRSILYPFPPSLFLTNIHSWMTRYSIMVSKLDDDGVSLGVLYEIDDGVDDENP